MHDETLVRLEMLRKFRRPLSGTGLICGRDETDEFQGLNVAFSLGYVNLFGAGKVMEPIRNSADILAPQSP